MGYETDACLKIGQRRVPRLGERLSEFDKRVEQKGEYKVIASCVTVTQTEMTSSCEVDLEHLTSKLQEARAAFKRRNKRKRDEMRESVRKRRRKKREARGTEKIAEDDKRLVYEPDSDSDDGNCVSPESVRKCDTQELTDEVDMTGDESEKWAFDSDADSDDCLAPEMILSLTTA